MKILLSILGSLTIIESEILFDEYFIIGEVLVALSFYCIINNWIFSHYDYGKGVWIGYFMRPKTNITLLRDLGWGSNK